MNNHTHPTQRDITRIREIHANNAELAKAILNCDKYFIIQKPGLSLRITTRHPYYDQLQAVLNNIADHHWAMVLHADAFSKGEPVPDHILPML